MTTVIGSIREYFLLSEARATAKIVPEDARVALDRQLAVGRQRSEAADALWSNGHVAEGLRLAAEAFDATVASVAPFADAIAPPGREPARAEPAEAEAPAGTDARAEEPAGEGDGEAEASASDEGDAKDGEEAEPAQDVEPSEAEASEADDAAKSEQPAAGDGEAEGAGVSTSEPEPAREERAPEPASLGDDAGEPAWAAVLRRRGLSEGKTREVIEAARQRSAKAFPVLDDQVTAADGELFQQLVTARRHVDRVLAPASMTPGQLAWTRVSRIGFATMLGLAVAFGVYFLLRTPAGVQATASGQWSAEFTPQHVIDGDEATEWILPDRQPGWVDLRITPPQHIETLRLKNSHNRHYNDRATNEYTVEIYSNGQVVRTIEGSWQGINPRPPWTEHAVGVDDVERIRFNVRSWHRNGGGLAEIDWD